MYWDMYDVWLLLSRCWFMDFINYSPLLIDICIWNTHDQIKNILLCILLNLCTHVHRYFCRFICSTNNCHYYSRNIQWTLLISRIPSDRATWFCAAAASLKWHVLTAAVGNNSIPASICCSTKRFNLLSTILLSRIHCNRNVYREL